MKKSILTLSILLFTTLFMNAQEQSDNQREKRKGPPSIKQIFKDLDVNEDDKISLKEAKGSLKKDFKKIDLNEDGFITKKEMKKAPKPKRREKPNN